MGVRALFLFGSLMRYLVVQILIREFQEGNEIYNPENLTVVYLRLAFN